MNTTASPAGHRFVLAALAGAILLASLGISIATVALPTLARTFAADVQQVQWVVLAYLLAVTVAIVSAGRLGDLYGHRRVLVAGLVLFTLASAACAGSPSLGWLIASRLAQGLGGAILMSLPLSIAKGRVAKARTGAVMGLLGTMSALGTAMGPSLGGMLMGALGWRAAFASLTVCGAGVLILVLKAIPPAETRGTATGGVDWAGSFWLSTVLLCVSLAATGSRVGIDIPLWLLLTVACVALAAFVRTERVVNHPLVPVVLLREQALATSLTLNLVVGAIMMATLVVGPFFLSFGLGLSEAETGLVMAVGPIAAALSGVPAGRATDRFGAERTLLAGLALAAVGLGGFAVLPGLVHVAGYILALVLITPGFQLFLAANNTAAMLGATEAHRGLVSGLLGLSRNLGFMTGASLMPLLFVSLLGEQGITGNSTQAIGHAFSITFLLAAGMCALALPLALAGRTGRRSVLMPFSASRDRQG